jgi:hypothetical protein
VKVKAEATPYKPEFKEYFYKRSLKLKKMTSSRAIIKRSRNAVRLSRPCMKSSLTIQEIMAAEKPLPDPGGIVGGLKWNVPSTFRESEGIW